MVMEVDQLHHLTSVLLDKAIISVVLQDAHNTDTVEDPLLLQILTSSVLLNS